MILSYNKSKSIISLVLIIIKRQIKIQLQIVFLITHTTIKTI